MNREILKSFITTITGLGAVKHADLDKGTKAGGFFTYEFTFADGSNLRMHRTGMVPCNDGSGCSRWPRPVKGISSLQVSVEIKMLGTAAAGAFEALIQKYKVTTQPNASRNGLIITLVGTASTKVTVSTKGA